MSLRRPAHHHVRAGCETLAQREDLALDFGDREFTACATVFFGHGRLYSYGAPSAGLTSLVPWLITVMQFLGCQVGRARCTASWAGESPTCCTAAIWTPKAHQGSPQGASPY
jgi:hypothetical protein